jgi:hypothetical protein
MLAQDGGDLPVLTSTIGRTAMAYSKVEDWSVFQMPSA